MPSNVSESTARPERLILIVEHDEGTVATYARMLCLGGFTVLTAFSAEAGLREIESSRPDAILVDFLMPDIDGLEFLRRLRTREEHRSIPVAIVTGGYFPDDIIKTTLRELGAEVVFKPLWLDDLANLVRRLVNSVDDREPSL